MLQWCVNSWLLFGRLGGGVEDDGEGHNVVGADVAVDEEAFAVFGDVVGEDVGGGDGCAGANLEEGHGGAAGEVAGGVDGRGHEDAGEPEVKDFFAVAAPTRLTTATARDLPFSSGTRKCGDVDFPVSRFVRGIGDPFSVGEICA